MDDILVLPISIFCILGLVLLGLTGQSQTLKQYRVENVIATELESISISGEVSSENLANLKRQLVQYGEYTVQLRLDRQAGKKEYDQKEIVDKQLRVGDTVHLLLHETKRTVLERLINSNLFFDTKGVYYDMRGYRYYNVTIVKDGRDEEFDTDYISD